MFLASLLGLWLPVSSLQISCRIQASTVPRIDRMATLELLMRTKKAQVDYVSQSPNYVTFFLPAFDVQTLKMESQNLHVMNFRTRKGLQRTGGAFLFLPQIKPLKPGVMTP